MDTPTARLKRLRPEEAELSLPKAIEADKAGPHKAIVLASEDNKLSDTTKKKANFFRALVPKVKTWLTNFFFPPPRKKDVYHAVSSYLGNNFIRFTFRKFCDGVSLTRKDVEVDFDYLPRLADQLQDHSEQITFALYAEKDENIVLIESEHVFEFRELIFAYIDGMKKSEIQVEQ